MDRQWDLMAYIDLIKQLDHDLNKLKIDYKKLQTDGQKNMYDFMRNRKPLAQFYKNGELVLLNRGDLVRGFEHILNRHYCHVCSGVVTARELLNIDTVLQKGRKLTTYEMNDRDHGAEGYEHITQNGVRLRLIIAADKHGVKRVVTFYSDRS